MGQNGTILVTLVLLAGFLAGCGRSSSSNPNVIMKDDASCQYSADQGAQADFTLLSSDRTEATFFGKRFNRNDLEAVVDASARETAKYAARIQAQVFKVTTTGGSCRMFNGVLDSAPADVRTYWERIAGGNLGGGTLAGLYLEPGMQVDGTHLPSTDSSAVIMVRDRGNRWDLVHEMMHHLFNRNIKSDRNTAGNRELRQSIVSLAKESDDLWKQFKSNGDEGALDAMMDDLTTFVRQNWELIRRYPLEEMTIERTLSEKYINRALNYVPNEVENSKAYIHLSALKARAALKQIQNGMISLQATLHKTGRYATQEQRTQGLINDLKARDQEIQGFQVEYFANVPGLRPPARMDFSETSFAPCQHMVDGSEFEQRLHNLTERLFKHLSEHLR